MQIILLGPPGAGKGTQAERIATRLGIAHISTGEILREAIQSGSELGKQVQSYLDAGNLVPDQLIIGVMQEKLRGEECSSGFLLDGFPRTVEQSLALDLMLKDLGKELSAVIQLEVSEEELVKRVLKRAADGSERSDDNKEVILNRLKVYRDQTQPLSAFYQEKGDLKVVDGLGTMDEVEARIRRALEI